MLSTPHTDWLKTAITATMSDQAGMICIVDGSAQPIYWSKEWAAFFSPFSRSATDGTEKNISPISGGKVLWQAMSCYQQILDILASGKTTALQLTVPNSSPRMNIQLLVQPLQQYAAEANFAVIQARLEPQLPMTSDQSAIDDSWIRRMANDSYSPMTIKDVNGHYLLANRPFMDLVGCTVDELTLRDENIFDTATVNRIRERDIAALKMRTIMPGEEVLVRGVDGQVLTYMSVRFPVYNQKKMPVAVGNLLLEVSTPEHFEATVAMQNSELQLLLDSIRSSIWYMDCWGLIKLANRQAQKMFPLEKSLGSNFMEVAPFWDDPAERHREIMMVMRTGESQLNSLESCQIGYDTYWFQVDKIPTKNQSGDVTGVLVVMSDISEQVHKERALEESEERYRAFIASSTQAVFRYDFFPPIDITLPLDQQSQGIAANARLTECNQVMARMFNVAHPRDLVGSSIKQTQSQTFIQDIDLFVQNGYRLEPHTIKISAKPNRDVYLQVSIIGVVENGNLTRCWGSTQDITEKQRYLDRLEYQATHDSLTSLPNRNFLYREIQAVLDKRSEQQKTALMILDLDRFKEINDTLGHHAGDKLLRQIGPRIQEELNDHPSLLARLGGDEFAVLIPRVRNNQHAVVIAHRILDAMSQPFEIEGYQSEISASIGIVIAPDQAGDLSTLMRYADVAMYHAKSNLLGVSVYNPEQDMNSPKRLALMNDLGRAIREDQLQVYFQPKVDIGAHRVYGFEALLRWHHPELGFIPPSEFVPIAESTNMIHAMTLWVLEASIAQCGLWLQEGSEFSVAVNLSPRNLLDDNLPTLISELLERYQVPPHLLELEITEGSIMADPQGALRALNAIDALGIELAIDDFGTGYSSLAYLKRLPVRQLKIDYSFVINMLEDPQDEIIVNSTIHLAHNLGLTVIAEGVETSQHLQRLHELGCDMAQGYLIGRPMPTEAVKRWLQKGDWC